MKQYQKYDLPGGDEIVVEIEEPVPAGEAPAARPEELVGKAARSLEQALEKIKPIARAVIGQLAELSATINEVNVEFAVKLSGQVGVVLATLGAEANFKVSLKWVRPASASPPARNRPRGACEVLTSRSCASDSSEGGLATLGTGSYRFSS